MWKDRVWNHSRKHLWDLGCGCTARFRGTVPAMVSQPWKQIPNRTSPDPPLANKTPYQLIHVKDHFVALFWSQKKLWASLSPSPSPSWRSCWGSWQWHNDLPKWKCFHNNTTGQTGIGKTHGQARARGFWKTLKKQSSLLTQLEGSKQTKGCPENVGVRFLAGQKKKVKIFTGIVCAKVFRHNANCKKSAHSDQQGFQRMELSS